MERFTGASEFREFAIKNGISKIKLDKAYMGSFLPEKGKFVDFEIAQKDTDMEHVRILTDDGSSISINSLQALGFEGKKEDVKLRQVENKSSPRFGKWVISGITRINPQFGCKMEDLVENLLGSSFEAKPVYRFTLRFKEGGYDTEEEARENIVETKFYEVKLLPRTRKNS